MKGPEGLASESCERRCRTVKTRSRRVGGSFYVLPSEIASHERSANYVVPEGVAYGCGVFGVTPDSDVTRKVKTMANAGTTVAAALGRAVPCLSAR
jgi:hypothetical protein